MMTPNTNVRVSILERLVPSLAFAVASISGAVGAAMVIRFFVAMRQAEAAGYAAFFGGMSEIEFAVGIVLVFAAVLCSIGVIVSVIRLFTTNTTASPPGILFLMIGLLSLVPPFALHFVLHIMKEIVNSPTPTEGGGVSSVADKFMTFAPFAFIAIGVIVLGLIAFTFIPFRSRPGRKSSPIICLILVELIIAVLAGIYFWEARTSIVDRDRERPEEPYHSQYSNSTPDTNSNENTISTVPLANTSSNTSSKSRGKTISGGVLTEKAIELPQPTYPAAARAVRAAGSVSVQVTVDEKGDVIDATAISGHALLRASAVQAARKAKFKPTMLSGQAVKVTGVIVYNFVP